VITFGIINSYTIWTWRGVVLGNPTTSQITRYVEEWMNDHLEDMLVKKILDKLICVII